MPARPDSGRLKAPQIPPKGGRIVTHMRKKNQGSQFGRNHSEMDWERGILTKQMLLSWSYWQGPPTRKVKNKILVKGIQVSRACLRMSYPVAIQQVINLIALVQSQCPTHNLQLWFIVPDFSAGGWICWLFPSVWQNFMFFTLTQYTGILTVD